MSLLGLDVGTTGCKAVAFDRKGQVLARSYREYPLLRPRSGWLELDPEVVWGNLRACIREVNSQLASDPVEALAVSSQGEAVVPVSVDGRVLANSPVTFDNRAVPQSEWWMQAIDRRRLYAITGQPLHPMFTINKIMWWREQEPSIYQRAWKFLCYGDFVLWKLGTEPVIDHTMAARTMAFDIRARRWSDEILTLAHLDADKLPQAAPSGTLVGKIPPTLATDLGFQGDVLAVTGGHDQPCGALGAGVMRSGEAMYAIGTTECIAPVFSRPVERLGDEGYPCYPHVAPEMYITLAGNFTGGALLRWYRDVLGFEERQIAARTRQDVYDVIIAQVTERPSNLLVLPHFAGTGSPFNDPVARGAIVGLTFDTRREDIVKAILEGITFELALNLKYLRRAGINIDELRAIGGGVKSRTWLQMKADIMATPVAALAVSEAACLGAALLAGWATGVYASLREAIDTTVRVRELFQPDPGRARFYSERLSAYEGLYPALRPINPLI